MFPVLPGDRREVWPQVCVSRWSLCFQVSCWETSPQHIAPNCEYLLGLPLYKTGDHLGLCRIPVLELKGGGLQQVKAPCDRSTDAILFFFSGLWPASIITEPQNRREKAKPPDSVWGWATKLRRSKRLPDEAEKGQTIARRRGLSPVADDRLTKALSRRGSGTRVPRHWRGQRDSTLAQGVQR